jgi:hypothetical protein
MQQVRGKRVDVRPKWKVKPGMPTIRTAADVVGQGLCCRHALYPANPVRLSNYIVRYRVC